MTAYTHPVSINSLFHRVAKRGCHWACCACHQHRHAGMHTRRCGVQLWPKAWLHGCHALHAYHTCSVGARSSRPRSGTSCLDAARRVCHNREVQLSRGRPHACTVMCKLVKHGYCAACVCSCTTLTSRPLQTNRAGMKSSSQVICCSAVSPRSAWWCLSARTRAAASNNKPRGFLAPAAQRCAAQRQPPCRPTTSSPCSRCRLPRTSSTLC